METAPATPNKNKRLLILLSILVLLIIGGLVLWFLLSQKTTPTSSGVEKPATISTKTATPAAKVATVSAPVVDNTALIKKALVAKTKISDATIDVTISQNDGTFAKGLVGTKGEETGGGYFLAVKIGDNWLIAYDGQATPDCTAVNPYNFPKTLVPECLDASGNLVTR